MADVFRVFLNWKIIECVVGMILYTAVIVIILYAVGFWRLEMLKDTVLWFLFAGFTMALRFVVSRENERILRQVFYDNVKLVVLLEFLIGTYVMSLPAETVLVAFVMFLTVLDAVARLDDANASVAKMTGSLLVVIGFAILGFAIFRAIGDFRSLGTMDTVRSIAFPPLMSISFVPFVYVLVLVSAYESMFLRLAHGGDRTADVIRYARRRILFRHGFSLRRLRDFAKRARFEIMQIRTTDDVDRLLESS